MLRSEPISLSLLLIVSRHGLIPEGEQVRNHAHVNHNNKDTVVRNVWLRHSHPAALVLPEAGRAGVCLLLRVGSWTRAVADRLCPH